MQAVGDDFGGQQENKAYVSFSTEPLENQEKSKELGRPVFDDVDFIEIVIAGDKFNRPKRVWGRPDDVQRFAKQYKAWKENNSADPNSGTPLHYIGLAPSQVAEFRHFGVHTVEQLAEMADSNAQNFHGIISLRQRARDYIETAKGNAPAIQLREELAKRDAVIATQGAQMKDILEELAQLRKAKTK